MIRLSAYCSRTVRRPPSSPGRGEHGSEQVGGQPEVVQEAPRVEVDVGPKALLLHDHVFHRLRDLVPDRLAGRLAQLLRQLAQDGGLNEWAIHPAHGTEQWQTIEPSGWQIRQSDHAFLTSPQAREILDHENITVIDYRPLQQAWNA
jgi:hypothetical protein